MNEKHPAAGLASLLSAQGRGPDKTLVHMSPEEVENLRNLARAQGIEMPINPTTGLPEAGWLTDFLKGAWNTVKKVGTAAIQNPQLTSALVGTAYGAIKGDLQKGLEAGMKAYAGATVLGGIPSVARAVDRRAAENYAKSIGMEGDKGTIEGFLRMFRRVV